MGLAGTGGTGEAASAQYNPLAGKRKASPHNRLHFPKSRRTISHMGLTMKYGLRGANIYNFEHERRQKAAGMNPASIKARRKAKAAAKRARAQKITAYAPDVPYRPGMKSDFYQTREWRKLRWQVLTASDGRCSMCGRGRAEGITLHVDHIHPRSRFPALELTRSNLQILCADCNIGKGGTSWSSR